MKKRLVILSLIFRLEECTQTKQGICELYNSKTDDVLTKTLAGSEGEKPSSVTPVFPKNTDKRKLIK